MDNKNKKQKNNNSKFVDVEMVANALHTNIHNIYCYYLEKIIDPNTAHKHQMEICSNYWKLLVKLGESNNLKGLYSLANTAIKFNLINRDFRREWVMKVMDTFIKPILDTWVSDYVGDYPSSFSLKSTHLSFLEKEKKQKEKKQKEKKQEENDYSSDFDSEEEIELENEEKNNKKSEEYQTTKEEYQTTKKEEFVLLPDVDKSSKVDIPDVII